jgi:hypothetical protein
MSDDNLPELSPDVDGALYVIGRAGPVRGGTLRILIPIAMQALRDGAMRVDIQLTDRRWLGADDIRELLARWFGAGVAFSVLLEKREVYHQWTRTMFRIGDDDSLTLLPDPRIASPSDLSLIQAGAAEEVSRMRRLDPPVKGFWART